MQVYTDRFWHAELVDEVLRLTRTSERIEQLEAVQASLDALATALRAANIEHSPRGLLLDTRNAPPTINDEFESLTSSYRVQLEQAFGRVATLVATQVGKLQMARLDRRDGTHSAVFDDEAEALAFLRG